MGEFVSVAVHEDGVAHIELKRPAAANAFDIAMARQLSAAVSAAAVNHSARAILLTGSGRRFCAGGDVHSFAHAQDRSRNLTALASELDGAVRALGSVAKPVVCAVQGAAAGAGLALVLSSDVVVVSRSAKFVFAYPEIGLTPDCGVSYLLPRAIGQQRALELALLRAPLSAQRALEWGLATEVTDDDPTPRARELCAAIAAGPAAALGQARRMLRRAWDLDRADAGAHEAQTIGGMVSGDEATLLINKFVAR